MVDLSLTEFRHHRAARTPPARISVTGEIYDLVHGKDFSSLGSERAIAPTCAHLLNEFARASGRWTRISHTSRTMLVSANRWLSEA